MESCGDRTQEVERYGTIRIFSGKEEETRGGQRRPLQFWPQRNVLHLGILVIVVTSGILIVWFGSPLYGKYHVVSRSLQQILAHSYHLLLGGNLVVRSGDKLNIMELTERLSSLDYVQKTRNLTPGSYRQAEDHIILYPRTVKKYAGPVRIDQQDNIIQLITACDSGRLLQELSLGRPVLTAFEKSIWEVRYPLSYSELPEALKMAVIATEDKNFQKHPGVDVRGIVRAAMVNLRHGRVLQGGSTITQQLVKNLTRRVDRSFAAKLEEVALALLLEFFYSKEDILEAYCNNIYLGQVGPFAIHGMGAASRHLMQKELVELSVEECAILAGLIRSPNPLSPLRHPAQSIARGRIVLAQLKGIGLESGNKGLPLDSLNYLDAESKELMPLAWYYQKIHKKIGPYISSSEKDSRLQIELSIDPFLQRATQYYMNQQLETLEKKKSLNTGSLQSGIAALDVESGGVRALVGGRDYKRSQFNRAVDAKRQIGSLVKPFVYLAAMEASSSIVPFQSRLVDDSPLKRRVNGKFWQPANYDHKYLGRITWRRAMAESRNIPAIRIGEDAGVEPVRELLKELGINKAPDSGPALFLGAVESSPLRMAAAYRAIASRGSYVRPFMVEQILKNGELLYIRSQGERQLLDPQLTTNMTNMLEAVLTEGTGRSVQKYRLQAQVAGKTGTSNNLHDGWFAGFSQDLAMAVWVGRDANNNMGYTGAASALPVWAKLMQSFAGQGSKDFSPIIKPKQLFKIAPVKTELAVFSKKIIQVKGSPLTNQSYRYFE